MSKNKIIALNLLFLLAIFAGGMYFVPKIDPSVAPWHIALILGGVGIFTLIGELWKR